MGTFVISIRANSLYYFQYNKDNGEVLLASEGYTSKSGCLNGVEAVKLYAKDDSKFIRMQNLNNSYYFALKATNGQILAISERYAVLSKMNEVIGFIKLNAPDAIVVDKSTLVLHK